MKTPLGYIFCMVVLISFSGCANGKNLQEKPPVPLEEAYYTTWTGGVKGAGSGLNLFIPTGSFSDAEIQLDSVYFRGKGTELVQRADTPGLYVGYFRTEGSKRPELIMHSDPKEEYGNEPPVLPQEMPFELKPDEAVISFEKNGKKGYYKISGIEKKDSDDIKIKNPENIQH